MDGLGLSEPLSERVESSTASGDLNHRETGPSIKREIVTVTVRRADYFALKAIGGPYPDEIAKALNYYVDLVRKTDWRPRGISFGWSRVRWSISSLLYLRTLQIKFEVCRDASMVTQ